MKRRALVSYLSVRADGIAYGHRVMVLAWPMLDDDVTCMLRGLEQEVRMDVIITSLAWLESPQDAGAE